jgi:uncharacterized protein YcfL
MKKLSLLVITALLITSCSTERKYPVTPGATKSEKAQQNGLRSQFRNQ